MWRIFGRFGSTQGPLNGGGFKRGGFPIWACPSFFVLYVLSGTFPIFLGFSRIARGWSGDFSRCPFPLSRPIKRTCVEQSRRVRDTIWTCPQKVGNPRVWKLSGLASLNTNLKPFFLGKIRRKICHTKSTEFFTLGGDHLNLLGAALRNRSDSLCVLICCHFPQERQHFQTLCRSDLLWP